MQKNKTNIFSVSLEQLKIELDRIESDHLVFIVDGNVYEIYRSFIQDLKSINKKVTTWIAPNGESVKNFENYENCIEELLDSGVHRKSHLVAFGGGATSDFAGFVAATILRGIKWSIVPTTLLAQVDAAIGGKTAINSSTGKNLVGAFYFPKNVFMCRDFLKTLDDEYVQSGLGEVIKYAFLDGDVFDAIVDEKSLGEIIALCAKYKQKIVFEDPKERGMRKFLNYGHTFGHAYESLTGLPHGVCVAWGIEMMDKLLQDSRYQEDLAVIKVKLGFQDNFYDVSNSDLYDFVIQDKKRISNNEIEVIVIEEIGKPRIETIGIDELQARLCQ